MKHLTCAGQNVIGSTKDLTRSLLSNGFFLFVSSELIHKRLWFLHFSLNIDPLV